MDRVILHCDMNAFYASVELLDHPELLDVPVAVTGDPEGRHGIILAKNEHAKRYGVVTAETIWSAQKKCPNLALLRAHHHKYHYYSNLINEIYSNYTNMVEPFSIDESWLDVTASTKLFGSGEEIANKIKNEVKKTYGLTMSIGVSFNKLFAKMGSDYKKPDAVTVISRENYKDILWPMPIRDLFSVGAKTASKLIDHGINTIGDLANTDQAMLESMLGKHGLQLYDYANGLDTAEVRLDQEKRSIKSVGNGITFKRDIVGADDIHTALTALSDTVAGRLRKYELKCAGVKVDIKDPEFKSISRQVQLDSPTNLQEEIHNAAFNIIVSEWGMKKPIRLITVTGINLVDEDSGRQITLFQEKEVSREKEEALARTMDTIREKYGSGSLTFGRIIGNDIGIELDEHIEE